MARTSSARREVRGAIQDGKARIDIELADPVTRVPGALVDTGFDGAIAVPIGTIRTWGRAEIDYVTVVHADDSGALRPSTIVEVLWLGERRQVRAIEVGPRWIVGMGLLNGCRIELRGSEVRIAKAPGVTARAVRTRLGH